MNGTENETNGFTTKVCMLIPDSYYCITLIVFYYRIVTIFCFLEIFSCCGASK